MTTIYVTDKDNLPKRHHADFYETERNLIHAALKHYAPKDSTFILDIGAGDGRWGEIASDYAKKPNFIYGVELRDMSCPEVFDGWYTNTNFLQWKIERKFDLIVSNPPYQLAEEFIKHAWTMLDGTMIMLLRLAFQSSIKRYNDLWLNYPPVTVAVCSRRPSFYGGGTNGTDYGIYVWKKGEGVPRQWKTELLVYDR